MSGDIYQNAYCVTYGFDVDDDCDKEPSMISDSPLITDDLIKQFDEHPDIKLLTFATGNKSVKKTTLTFQLDKLEPDYSDLFVTQLSNNSNGLYSAEVHNVGTDTEPQKFISVKTGNTEVQDNPNIRLQQWIDQSVEVIDKTSETTKNFIPNNRKNHEILTSNIEKLETAVTKVAEVVETSETAFTEQAKVNTALANFTKEVTKTTLTKIAGTTAVRDILRSPIAVKQTITHSIPPAPISVLPITPGETESIADKMNLNITPSVNMSNFDTVNNNVMKILDRLDSWDSTVVKVQLEKELLKLGGIPKRDLDEYIQKTLNVVNYYPFQRIEDIKSDINNIANDFTDEFGDTEDFLVNPEGEVLSAADNVLEEFGMVGAEEVLDKVLNPGNLDNVIGDFASKALEDVFSRLPQEDIQTIMDVIKSLKQYDEIPDIDIGDYADILIDKGLDTEAAKNVMNGMKERVDEFGEVLDKVESKKMELMEAVDKLGEIGLTLQEQLNKVKEFTSNASTLLNSINLSTDIEDYLPTIDDMAELLGEAAESVATSCGSYGGAKCLLAYGLKGVGLL